MKESFEIEITGLNNEGEGVGRYNNLVYFVKDAIPGDLCVIQETSKKKNFAYGEIVSLTQPSDDRQLSPCPHSHLCGGCQLLHMNRQAELDYKKDRILHALQRIGKIEIEEIEDMESPKTPVAQRNTAQFQIDINEEGYQVGFFQKSSHKLVDIDYCMAVSQEINELLPLIRRVLATIKPTIYNPKTKTGLLRHMMVRSTEAGECSILLVITEKALPGEAIWIDMLTTDKSVASIDVNYHPGSHSSHLGKITKTIWGKGYVEEAIQKNINNQKEIQYYIPPTAFFQTNKAQMKVLYNKISELLTNHQDKNLLDLYAGIGCIGIFIADQVKQVSVVEMNEGACKYAKINGELNELDNFTVYHGLVDQVLEKNKELVKNIDIIIVDPPRKGLDTWTMKSIVNVSPREIIYVSCDPSTLARDLKELSVHYQVKKVEMVDMFPYTTHVEVLCLLEKK